MSERGKKALHSAALCGWGLQLFYVWSISVEEHKTISVEENLFEFKLFLFLCVCEFVMKPYQWKKKKKNDWGNPINAAVTGVAPLCSANANWCLTTNQRQRQIANTRCSVDQTQKSEASTQTCFLLRAQSAQAAEARHKLFWCWLWLRETLTLKISLKSKISTENILIYLLK